MLAAQGLSSPLQAQRPLALSLLRPDAALEEVPNRSGERLSRPYASIYYCGGGSLWRPQRINFRESAKRGVHRAYKHQLPSGFGQAQQSLNLLLEGSKR